MGDLVAGLGRGINPSCEWEVCAFVCVKGGVGDDLTGLVIARETGRLEGAGSTGVGGAGSTGAGGAGSTGLAIARGTGWLGGTGSTGVGNCTNEPKSRTRIGESCEGGRSIGGPEPGMERDRGGSMDTLNRFVSYGFGCRMRGCFMLVSVSVGLAVVSADRVVLVSTGDAVDRGFERGKVGFCSTGEPRRSGA